MPHLVVILEWKFGTFAAVFALQQLVGLVVVASWLLPLVVVFVALPIVAVVVGVPPVEFFVVPLLVAVSKFLVLVFAFPLDVLALAKIAGKDNNGKIQKV